MQVDQINEQNLKEFQREIETLVKLKPQKNLVSFVGVSQKDSNFYVVTELCNGGSLFDLLHQKQDNNLPWLQRIKICKDIAQGMECLHSFNPPIIHRDLKSLNLLLDIPFQEDKYNYNIKIADFGLSRSQSQNIMTSVLGTFHWMAPEIFDNKQYTTKADVYSFAIVIWEICTRNTPYTNMSTIEIMRAVCDKKRPPLDQIPNDCPPKLIDIMKDCWEQEPQDRPDFQEIIERLEEIEEQLKDFENRKKQISQKKTSLAVNLQKTQEQQQNQQQQQIQQQYSYRQTNQYQNNLNNNKNQDNIFL